MIFLRIVLLSTIVISAVGQDHVLNWDCTDNLQEICQNMCYGAYCRGVTTSLTWDDPDPSVKDARADGAGCGRDNRCSKTPYGSGFQCDEYPFGSTSNADHTIAVNRCVPRSQNARQGALLKNFYHSNGRFAGVGLGGTQGPFRISFANGGDLQYCKSPTATPDCTNDGNEYDRNGKANDNRKRDENLQEDNAAEHCLLSNGQDVFVPDSAKVGDIVWTPRAHNSTLFDEQIRTHVLNDNQGLEQYNYMQDNLVLERSEIVDVLS